MRGHIKDSDEYKSVVPFVDKAKKAFKENARSLPPKAFSAKMFRF